MSVVEDPAVVSQVLAVRSAALTDDDLWVVVSVTCPAQDVADAPRYNFQPGGLSAGNNEISQICFVFLPLEY